MTQPVPVKTGSEAGRSLLVRRATRVPCSEEDATPLGPRLAPRHGRTVGSYRGAFSWRGTPVSPKCALCGGPLAYAWRDAFQAYRGTSLTRKRTPLGPYRKPMPRVLARGVPEGWAFSYGRGTPVVSAFRSSRFSSLGSGNKSHVR